MDEDKSAKEIVYDLGFKSSKLKLLVKAIQHDGTGCQDVLDDYKYFKIGAAKLGVTLQNATTDMSNLKEFIYKTMDEFQCTIEETKSPTIRELFVAGVYVGHIKVNSMGSLLELKPSDSSCIEQNLQDTCNGLSQYSKNNFGVDVSDILQELHDTITVIRNNGQDKELLESIFHKFKIRLCDIKERKSLQTNNAVDDYRRSEVDPTRIITDQMWTVSLVRLPDCSQSQHAFLILEGKSCSKSMIWFADFVAKDALDVTRPGTENGRVRLESSEKDEGDHKQLLYQCKLNLMSVRGSDRLVYSIWPIDKAKAEFLLAMIQAKQDDPPKYNILGDTKLAGSSAGSSSNPIGHNCFTFARMLLRDLGDRYIDFPQDTFDAWILSATSRFLRDKQPTKHWYQFPGFMGFLLVIGLISGLTLGRYLQRK